MIAVNIGLLVLGYAHFFNLLVRGLKNNKPIAMLVFCSFVTVATLGFVNSNFHNFYTYDNDWFYLEGRALYFLYREMNLSEMLSAATGRQLYSFLIVISYKLFGQNEFPLIILNALLHAYTILLTNRIASHFGANKRHAFLAASFVAVFPTIFIYSIQPSREPLVIFCFAAGLYLCLQYTKTQNPLQFLGSMGLLSIASILHTVMLVALLGFLVIAAKSTFGRTGAGRAHKGRRTISAIAMASIGLPALVFFIASGAGLAKLGGDLSALNADVLEGRFITQDGDNRAGYLSSTVLRSQSLPDHILSIPKRIWLFSTKPYPNDIGAFADILAVGINVLALAFIILVLRSKKSAITTKSRMSTLVVVACMYVVLAAGTNNWGTAVRHKSKLILPLVTIAFAMQSDRRKSHARYLHEPKQTVA